MFFGRFETKKIFTLRQKFDIQLSFILVGTQKIFHRNHFLPRDTKYLLMIQFCSKFLHVNMKGIAAEKKSFGRKSLKCVKKSALKNRTLSY